MRSRYNDPKNLRRQGSLYGMVGDDFLDASSFFFPEQGVENVDDVTGKWIPAQYVGFQDGLVKDMRTRAGSWEDDTRHYKDLTFVMYDPTKGFQRRPAGED